MLEEFLQDRWEERLNITPKEFDTERALRRIRNGYRYNYHVNEVIRRITCAEKNLPKINLEEFDNDFKKCRYCLYKMLTYQQRKSLIYYWCTLNNIKELFIEDIDYETLKIILNDVLLALDGVDIKKTPEYRLMIYCICKRMNYNYILPYLFFKRNEEHEKLIEKVLNELFS